MFLSPRKLEMRRVGALKNVVYSDSLRYVCNFDVRVSCPYKAYVYTSMQGPVHLDMTFYFVLGSTILGFTISNPLNVENTLPVWERSINGRFRVYIIRP